MIPVFEQGKVRLTRIFRYLDQRILRLFTCVQTDGENLNSLFFARVEEGFQLPELESAVRSEIAPIKDEHDILLPAVIGQTKSLAVVIGQSEVRRGHPWFHSLKVGNAGVNGRLRRRRGDRRCNRFNRYLFAPTGNQTDQ